MMKIENEEQNNDGEDECSLGFAKIVGISNLKFNTFQFLSGKKHDDPTHPDYIPTQYLTPEQCDAAPSISPERKRKIKQSKQSVKRLKTGSSLLEGKPVPGG